MILQQNKSDLVHFTLLEHNFLDWKAARAGGGAGEQLEGAGGGGQQQEEGAGGAAHLNCLTGKPTWQVLVEEEAKLGADIKKSQREIESLIKGLEDVEDLLNEVNTAPFLGNTK